jgi:hypothetical protein
MNRKVLATTVGLVAGEVIESLEQGKEKPSKEHTPDEIAVEPAVVPIIRPGLPGSGAIQAMGALVFDGPVAKPVPKYHPGYLPNVDMPELVPFHVIDLNSFRVAGITPEIVHTPDGFFATLKSLTTLPEQG